MNDENDIIVTARDHAELSSVIAVTGKVSHASKMGAEVAGERT